VRPAERWFRQPGPLYRLCSALPDLFALAADWGKSTLAEALDWLTSRQALSTERGAEAARLILSDNAEQLYRLRGR
jgi:hypothetical protein